MLKSMMDRISESNVNRQDVGRDPELERSLAESLQVQRYIYNFLFKDVSVSEQECEDFYKEHLAEYIRNDEVHLREILVDDLDQAQKILAALKASQNKNFSELARLYSKGARRGRRRGDGELPARRPARSLRKADLSSASGHDQQDRADPVRFPYLSGRGKDSRPPAALL